MAESLALLELLGQDVFEAFFELPPYESDEVMGGAGAEVESELPELGGAEMDRLLAQACENFEKESDIDRLLVQACENFEQESKPPQQEVRRFAEPKTEDEVAKARKASVPKKTQSDTSYCVRLWNEWRRNRNSIATTEVVPENLVEMDAARLQHWMSRFVLEVRKKDGSEYPANTLHHICCGIMRHLRQSGRPELDLFKDPAFSDFRATLDSEMKRIQSMGIGSKRRQAEPLTEEEEELLWKTGQLGHHSPQALVDTVFYMCGTYFALRSGQEHRALRFQPSQIELVQRPGQRAFLQYTEDLSKNNPGGLKGRKNKPKVVTQHENLDRPSRCFVKLFQLYNNKCPPDRPKDALYLQPLRNPTDEKYWYSSRPVGHCTLSGTVARLCKAAGISGYRTNHSLRATAATRLYQAGVDEQLIMERTGHHSVDGVRSYKRTSAEQQENLSDILALSKKPRSDTTQPSSSHSVNVAAPPSTSFQQFTHTRNTQQQVKFHPHNLQHMFTFNACPNIHVNIHIH